MFRFYAGILHGIFENFAAYQHWIHTTSARAKLSEMMLDICRIINDPECPTAVKHRDLDTAQVRKSERAIQNVMTAISHSTNPLRTPNKEKLFSLASGAPVPADVEVDVLRANTVGKTLKEDFIQNCLGYASTKCFFDTVKQQKL